MICITLTHESICSTARAAAAVLGVIYIPHTMTQYLLLIDRVSHQDYIVAVTTAVLAGVAPPVYPNTFSESLASAHSELQCAFDEHISRNHWDIIHTGADTVALNAAQTVQIADSLATLMKDCNSYLTNTLCQVLATLDMTVYHYLTYLDFVKDASGCKTNFGRIPQAEVHFPHVQLFPKLAAELFKVRRLLGSSSDNHYAIFPDIHLGLTSTLDSYTTRSKLILGLMLPPFTISLR